MARNGRGRSWPEKKPGGGVEIPIPPQPTKPTSIMSEGEEEPMEADAEPMEAEPVLPEAGEAVSAASTGTEATAALSDRDGQRLISTQTVQHDYLPLNGKVARETIAVDGTVTTVMDFIYDESGRPFALKYSDDGGKSFDTYYYVLNLQWDVVKLVWYIPGFEYEAVATYTYDVWGNVTATTAAGNTPATTTLVYRNPIRYRGYVYDNETGFYYLQSRYYDPANHRFINADAYASTGQGFTGTNMFVYCLNNPISYEDSLGNSPQFNNSFHAMHTLEDPAPGGFWFTPVFYKTMDEAATAAGKEANLLTQETDMEYACAIYEVGGTYYYGSIYMGEHISGSPTAILEECEDLGATIAAYVHTHAYCTCTARTANLFSVTYDNEGAIIDGDAYVVKSSGVPLYLASPSGQLLKLTLRYDQYLCTTYINSSLPVDPTVCECPYL